MPDIPDTVKTQVYYAAKDNMAITLYALLSEQSPETVRDLLHQAVLEEDGQQSTPLVVAAQHGNDKVVKMLLSKYSIDIEQEGMVKFDGYAINGATALWCAAGAGHLNVVKTLVNAGADVNHATKTNSTPLRAACFIGELNIVRYLVEHKADVNIGNIYNNTCLMIASYRGHPDIVSYLLEKGADPNEKTNCGATALHFAAECGHLEIVTELLDYGAKLSLNEDGATPLIIAADHARARVVKYLAAQPFVTREQMVEAYELLGASFANDQDHYCIEKSYWYLKLAMDLRFLDPDNIIHKTLVPPIPAYENRVECRTPEELADIAHDSNAIHMESLAIRERILGQQNAELAHPIIYRGAVFADGARFDRCVELWLHALYLRQKNKTSVVKDLLRFAQVFSQMVHVGVDLDYPVVEEVIKSAILEIERNKTIILFGPKDDVESIQEEMESNLTTILYFLVISSKLLANPAKSEMYSYRLSVLAFQINKLGVRTRDGETLLHLCLNSETPVDDFHIQDVCKFPCASTAKLLIQCGADVNAMDRHRNTPLHVIANYQDAFNNFRKFHSIMCDLSNAGAHRDIVNDKGETPLDVAKTGVARTLLLLDLNPCLKCLAAKVVQTYKIPYRGLVPETLESFIGLHGPGRSYTPHSLVKDEIMLPILPQ